MFNQKFQKNYLSLKNQMDELLNNFINPVVEESSPLESLTRPSICIGYY